MKQNKFDLVMDYIDANIQNSPESLKKDISKLIGFNSNAFCNCFSVLTNDTLFHYIIERKMYFASVELRENLEKPICDIALDYGYSEQSSFTRAMKSYCKCTPNDVRKGVSVIPNKKCTIKDFINENYDTHTQRILQALKNNENLSSYNMEMLVDLENASKEFGIDFDTCCQIADLAEKLEVSPFGLIEKCFELIVEEENDITQEEKFAIEFGLESYEELKEICHYFDCKYYDLDSFMVKAYREEMINTETLKFSKMLDELAEKSKNGIEKFENATSETFHEKIFYAEDLNCKVVQEACIIDDEDCIHHDIIGFYEGNEYSMHVELVDDDEPFVLVQMLDSNEEIVIENGEWYFT